MNFLILLNLLIFGKFDDSGEFCNSCDYNNFDCSGESGNSGEFGDIGEFGYWYDSGE